MAPPLETLVQSSWLVEKPSSRRRGRCPLDERSARMKARSVRSVQSVAGAPARSVTSRAAGAALSSVAALVLVGAVAGEARAQSLRPNIMFVVDNSGSMQENSTGNWVGENT